MRARLLVVIAALLASSPSCKKEDKTGPEPRADEPAGEPAGEPAAAEVLDGAYRCGFGVYGEAGDRFLCLIATEDGRRTLRKMHGTEQVRGTITPTGAGFRFEGDYASDYPTPFVARVTAEFAAEDGGRYRGTMKRPHDDSDATLTLWFETAEYGGATYGDQHAAMNWTAEEVEATVRENEDLEREDAEGEQ
jgi:hypothetical protein